MLGSLGGFCRIEFQLSPQAAKSQPEMAPDGILGSLGVSQLLMFSSLTGLKEKWPFRLKLKPGQAGAQEEFDRMMGPGVTGKEFYSEWKRV